jgi:polysaccharide export outer membrane protein
MRSKPIFILLLSVILLSSCNSYKRLIYFQGIAEEQGSDSLFLKQQPIYTLQPADILYIRVITPDESIDKLFNPMFSGSGSQSYAFRSEGMYYSGYMINDSGYIDLPIIEEIKVQDLTIEQAKDTINKKAAHYLNNAQIIVKLANFRFTVLGEVKSPGTKTIQDDRVSIMEAISYAGDITYNGNRENLLIIRPTKEGSETYRIDLTNKELVETEQYYILPNDILYVEPLRTTLFRERASDYVFFLSAMSSTLSAVLLVINLLQ